MGVAPSQAGRLTDPRFASYTSVMNRVPMLAAWGVILLALVGCSGKATTPTASNQTPTTSSHLSARDAWLACMGATQSQALSGGITHDPIFPPFADAVVKQKSDGTYEVTIVIPDATTPHGVSSTCEVRGTLDRPIVLWQHFVFSKD